MTSHELRQWVTTVIRLGRRAVDDSDRYFAHHPWQKFAWQTGKAIWIFLALCVLADTLPKQPAELFWIVIYFSPFIFVGVIVGLVFLGRRYGASAVFSVFTAVAILSIVQWLLDM